MRCGGGLIGFRRRATQVKVPRPLAQGILRVGALLGIPTGPRRVAVGVSSQVLHEGVVIRFSPTLRS